MVLAGRRLGPVARQLFQEDIKPNLAQVLEYDGTKACDESYKDVVENPLACARDAPIFRLEREVVGVGPLFLGNRHFPKCLALTVSNRSVLARKALTATVNAFPAARCRELQSGFYWAVTISTLHCHKHLSEFSELHMGHLPLDRRLGPT